MPKFRHNVFAYTDGAAPAENLGYSLDFIKSGPGRWERANSVSVTFPNVYVVISLPRPLDISHHIKKESRPQPPAFQMKMRTSNLLVVLPVLASTANTYLTSTSSTNTPEPTMTVTCSRIVDKKFCVYGCACKCVGAMVSCLADGKSCYHNDGMFCEERCSCSSTKGMLEDGREEI